MVTVIGGAFPVSKRDAFIALDGLVDKMPDIKLKGPASEVGNPVIGTMFAFSKVAEPVGSSLRYTLLAVPLTLSPNIQKL